MIPSEFALRRVHRKLRADGPSDTAVRAAELFVRKHVGRRVFDPFVEHGFVKTVPRSEIRNRATKIVELDENTTVAPTMPFVSQFPHGYVLTETGLALTDKFEIIEESAATPKQAQQAMMAMASRELFMGHLPILPLFRGNATSEYPVLDTVTPLIPRYPTNYYHWMVETVPKIRYVRAFANQTGEDVPLLLPAEAPGFVDETLDLLDWPESEIIRATEPVYKVRALVVPSFPERTAADFAWLRDEILDAVLTNSEDFDSSNDLNNKVYVSRAKAVSRRVVNEDEVMEVLSEYGFERYLLENRSLAENARLFSQADIVVGPHGAGLTDIIFADDCALVELFGSRLNMAYKNLSKTLGIEYEPMYCEADSSDIVVDTDKLEGRIAAIIG